MTREEKIELLNKLLGIEEKNDIGNLTRAERGEFQQWINDAIDQEPCDKCVYSTKDGYCQYDDIAEAIPPFEPCEDVVNRILKRMWNCRGTKTTNIDKVRMEQIIIEELFPTYLQKPKTGHWIAQDIHNCHTNFKCSKCGYIHNFMHLYGEPKADYTYCPNCGCRMIEPPESEG